MGSVFHGHTYYAVINALHKWRIWNYTYENMIVGWIYQFESFHYKNFEAYLAYMYVFRYLNVGLQYWI